MTLETVAGGSPASKNTRRVPDKIGAQSLGFRETFMLTGGRGALLDHSEQVDEKCSGSESLSISSHP